MEWRRDSKMDKNQAEGNGIGLPSVTKRSGIEPDS